MITERCLICRRWCYTETVKIFKLKHSLKRYQDDPRNEIEICHRCKQDISWDKVVKMLSKKEDWKDWAWEMANITGHPILEFLPLDK
jgi:hypothetical protein